MANIRTAMNRGAFDFLTKPIDFADLETTIAKTLRHLEVLREARRRQSGGRAGACVAVALFLAQPRRAARRRRRRVDLAGQRREVASLFTDIAGFTALVETIEPAPLGALLNEYLVGMTDIVFAHEGTVAKIVGDALHVLFGAPGEQPDHAARAVACALELDDFAAGVPRDAGASKGVALGATRIGVHAGPAIVGNFGGGRFFDYTAYGDTINIAARLEAANKQLGTRICVSASAGGEGRRISAAGRSATWCCGAARSRCAPSSRCRPSNIEDAVDAGYLEAFAKLEARRSRRARRLRRAGRQAPGRPPRELPPQAPAEWRDRNAHRHIVMRASRRADGGSTADRWRANSWSFRSSTCGQSRPGSPSSTSVCNAKLAATRPPGG